MSKELGSAAEAWRLSAGRLPLFEQIAQGFLESLASYQESGEHLACLSYLDDPVKIDGASYPRRAVVLAIEDLKQKIEAPLTLRCEARAQLTSMKLGPVPELTLYRDIASAILRIDAAFRLVRINKFAVKPERETVLH